MRRYLTNNRDKGGIGLTQGKLGVTRCENRKQHKRLELHVFGVTLPLLVLIWECFMEGLGDELTDHKNAWGGRKQMARMAVDGLDIYSLVFNLARRAWDRSYATRMSKRPPRNCIMGREK